MTATLALVFALGLRHGMDADHLAAIDGFSRLRPSRWNGVLFGLGHGLVVTALALLVDRLGANFGLGWLAPYLFLGVAALNLWRLLRPAAPHAQPSRTASRAVLASSPLLMGLLLAVGMETSSQLSALALSERVPPLLLGLVFTLGMVLTDGMDGLLAAQLQRGQQADPQRARLASQAMGWMVVALSLTFALCDLAGVDLGEIANPLGFAVFAVLVALRVWSRTGRAAAVAA
ncbi:MULTISPECIES: HoxN/HupN/NixA family nickel/cobalt transporter [Deinococcus]|uniref:Nickel/cobalt efflux system n=2 Tax=Deinococcus TaxID=1298 RepID=A0A221T1H4_9DEIO|nr:MULTISPECIES: nickel transporter [Deinococcus]ASN82753.1 nickel transporter [Deinococcus ficus]MDP9766407.1 high-affinity nickel-transport protein [Deinococcus enclensis]